MSSETERKQDVKEALPPADLEALSISGEDAKVERKNSTGDNHEERTHNDDDEDLFKPQPTEECPLCLTTLPILVDEMTCMNCCGKTICNGCAWKHEQVLDKINAERALDDPPKPPLQSSCAFCRKPNPTSNEEMIKMVESRMAVGDPEAFVTWGNFYVEGKYGLTRDEGKAFEFYHRAAELGSADACFNVSLMYEDGEGVERDASKHEFYLKKAAKNGHITCIARNIIGCVEWNRRNYDVAVKHWVVSASAGYDQSTKFIGIAYRKKYATKDQYEKAIRLCQDAKDEMASEERDKAKAALQAAGRDML